MGREWDQGLRDVVAGRFGALRRSAYLMCGDWSMADDLAATVLAAYVPGTGTRRDGESDDSARGALMDAFLVGRWRRMRRRERVFAGDVDMPAGSDPVVRVAVLAALSRLPPRRRAVIVLRHWEELSVFETADVLGSAARAVAAHEVRGLATLRETLADLLPEGPVPATVVRRRRGGRHAATRHGRARQAATRHAATRHAATRHAATRHRHDARRADTDAAEIDPGLHDLLTQVVADEPPPGDGVARVFQRAERLRRRRARVAVAASVCTVLSVALAGYGLTEAVLPRTASALLHRPTSDAVPAGDPVSVVRLQARIAAALAVEGLRPGVDRHGSGWRRYTVVAAGAGSPDRTAPRGTVQVVTYTTPGGMCFPVPSAARSSCARAEQTGHGVEFVRYSGDDADGRFHQVIARRTSDGRTVAVIAAGPPGSARSATGPDGAGPDGAGPDGAGPDGSGDAEPAGTGPDGAGSAAGDAVPPGSSGAAGSGAPDPGAPPLTAGQVTALAIDPALPDAFGADEWCDRVDPGCPELQVPLIAEDSVTGPR